MDTADRAAGDSRDEKRWERLAAKHLAELRGYQTPMQVCPRGCEHHEPARRDIVTRTRFGRARMHVKFCFETKNCPLCGAPLIRSCARCGNAIFAPIPNRCRFCGMPPPWAVERRSDSDRGGVQRWREENGVNAPAIPLYRNPKHGGIWVVEGDITRIDVDAIVSNDDVDGQMWSQVSRAIKGAAGSDVERMARENRPYKLGQAWWTKAGALKLRGIIHVAAVGREGQSSLATVRDCLDNAIQLAKDERCGSLGVAAIGSNLASVLPKQWFREFAEVALAHLGRRVVTTYQPLDVVLVLYECPDFEAIVSFLQRAVWDSWVKLGRDRAGEPTVRLESRLRGVLRQTRWPGPDVDDEVVDLFYRWNLLERRIKGPAIVDIDMLGGETDGGRRPFRKRAKASRAVDGLLDLVEPETLIGEKLRAARAVLATLQGRPMPFVDYVEQTLGVTPVEIEERVIDGQHRLVTELLAAAGYPHTEEGVRRIQSESAIGEDEIRDELSAAVENVVPRVYEAIELDKDDWVPFEIEFVARDAYWSNWTDTDPATGGLRLQVNTHKRIAWWPGKAEMLALHEIGGHVCQAVMWRRQIDQGELPRTAGVSTVFGPEAFCLEGLAQSLSWLLPQNPLSEPARRAQEMSHLGVLVWNNVHLMLHAGKSTEDALSYARRWAPGYRSEEAATKQADEIRNDPILRTYLYAYGASAYYYRTLADSLDVEARTAFLRDLYARPISFEELSKRLGKTLPSSA
jgi:O-acetyl-ADP-ribose deacetylase (regulator of RNase III)